LKVAARPATASPTASRPRLIRALDGARGDVRLGTVRGTPMPSVSAPGGIRTGWGVRDFMVGLRSSERWVDGGSEAGRQRVPFDRKNCLLPQKTSSRPYGMEARLSQGWLWVASARKNGLGQKLVKGFRQDCPSTQNPERGHLGREVAGETPALRWGEGARPSWPRGSGRDARSPSGRGSAAILAAR